MNPNLNIPYSGQYNTITREGHERQPPAFGAPTLVWHLAISPHWPEETPGSNDKVETFHAKLADEYESVRRSFFKGINRILAMLQEQAAFPRRDRPYTFDPDAVPPPWEGHGKVPGEPFGVTEPGTIRFTLWWREGDPEAEPSDDALRIKVHAEAHRDFVTITFYLDAGDVWDRPTRLVRGHGVTGKRRQRIFAEVGTIQDTSEERLVSSGGVRPVDKPVLPEEDITDLQAEALMGASRYLYSDVWDEFCGAFDIRNLAELLRKGDQGAGRVFANFRGLVVSTRGLDGRPEPFPGSAGAESFARFAGNGGLDPDGRSLAKEPNEANAVVKAFWPFIRRVTPFADLREYIACGVLNWRALYVTALGSPRAFDWREEAQSSEAYIRMKHLPEEHIDPAGRYDSLSGVLSGERMQNPLRYLVLTKGEPHPQQIGRIVDRVNIMGTLRLIALRDWTIIRDASTQIQLRGLELDTIMKKWSVGSRDVKQKFKRFEWFPYSRHGAATSGMKGCKSLRLTWNRISST